jgi:hypothetical protein
MKWFRKYFGRGDYSTDQELFANLYALSKSPAGMIMLAGSNGVFGDNTVYLRIPEGLAGSFPEYETVRAARRGTGDRPLRRPK